MAHVSDDRHATGRTLAQTFCLAVGATLVAVGVLGFVFGGSGFGAGDDIGGKDFIVFEVNGWHNLVHIISGVPLLLAARSGPLAAASATAFGLVYALVTVWGLVDGDDIFNLVPVDSADNVLHLALAVASLAVGLTAGGLMAAARGRTARDGTPPRAA